MLKRIFRNKEFVFAFAEAAIIFFSFIIVTLYNNYNEYGYHISTGFSFYGLYATFNREIVSENGTVYPAGTVFEVYFISDDGELGLSSNDGIIHEAVINCLTLKIVMNWLKNIK